jgi:hypothetical protein
VEESGPPESTVQGDGTILLGDPIADVDDELLRELVDHLSALEEKAEDPVCMTTVFHSEPNDSKFD